METIRQPETRKTVDIEEMFEAAKEIVAVLKKHTQHGHTASKIMTMAGACFSDGFSDYPASLLNH